MKFNELSTYKLGEKIQKEKIAFLPIGAVEVHGEHLPLGTDAILAEKLTEKIVQKVGGLILPALHYAPVWSLGQCQGTISIPPNLLTELIKAIGLEVQRNGFRVLAIINAHLGNLNAIQEAVRAIYDGTMPIYYFTYPGAEKAHLQVMESTVLAGGFFHADEIETSYLLYLAEEYVDMEKAVDGTVAIPAEMAYTPIRWDEFNPTYVMGDATKASKEKGQYVLEQVIENIVNILQKHL